MKTPILFCVAAALLAAPAYAVNKCTLPDGRVVYSDMPCSSGRAEAVRVDPMNPNPQDQAYARLKIDSYTHRYGRQSPQDVEAQLRERARMQVQVAQRQSALCDQMRRSIDSVIQSNARHPSPAGDNNLRSLQQNFALSCK